MTREGFSINHHLSDMEMATFNMGGSHSCFAVLSVILAPLTLRVNHIP